MKYVGIDLHKKTISIWVVNQERQKLDHKRLHCLPVEPIVEYFGQLGEFEAVVEATAGWNARSWLGLARVASWHAQSMDAMGVGTLVALRGLSILEVGGSVAGFIW